MSVQPNHIEPELTSFIDENTGWEKKLAAEVNEIPGLKKKVKKIRRGHWQLLEKKLDDQQQDFEELNAAVKAEKDILKKEALAKHKIDAEGFSTHDILRERIRAVEKNFFELKRNFMGYLSTLL